MGSVGEEAAGCDMADVPVEAPVFPAHEGVELSFEAGNEGFGTGDTQLGAEALSPRSLGAFVYIVAEVGIEVATDSEYEIFTGVLVGVTSGAATLDGGDVGSGGSSGYFLVSGCRSWCSHDGGIIGGGGVFVKRKIRSYVHLTFGFVK